MSRDSWSFDREVTLRVKLCRTEKKDKICSLKRPFPRKSSLNVQSSSVNLNLIANFTCFYTQGVDREVILYVKTCRRKKNEICLFKNLTFVRV